MDRRRRPALVGIAAAALLVLSAASSASAVQTAFGGNFNPNTDPDNASPPQECPDAGACTWVMNFAFKGSGTTQLPLRAPKNGTIGKIKLLAAESGSFRLYLARTKNNPTRSKLVRKGPSISYNGNGGGGCAPNCTIETFNINLTVKQGDILAFRAAEASFLRCNSGGARILNFQPPLAVGGSFQQPDDDDGCFVLMKAIYK